MTSVLQPNDAGIIKAFKSHYKRLLLEYFLKSINEKDSISFPGVKEAIYLIREALGVWLKIRL